MSNASTIIVAAIALVAPVAFTLAAVIVALAVITIILSFERYLDL
jgi:hypothetical protein